MQKREDPLFSVRDIIDSQLESSDGVEIGRVADIEVVWCEDGSLAITHLLTGPQALAGRVARPLRSLFQRVLRGRFEHQIAIQEVDAFGPTLRLRGKARDYPVGQSDHWVAEHILRWIPGSGY
jgi:hypothetical protein